MPEKKICTYRDEAEFIRVVCLEGKTGTMDCPGGCGRKLQLGVPRCPHGNLWEFRGYCTVCQSDGVKSPGTKSLPTDKKLKTIIAELPEEPRVCVEEIEPEESEVEEPETDIERELETAEEVEYGET